MFLTVVKDLTTNFGSNYTNHCFAKPSSNNEIRVSDERFNTTFDETKVACTKIDVTIPEVKRRKVSTKVDYEHHSQHFFENTKEEMKITVYNSVIDKMLNGVKVRFSQDTLNLIDSVGNLLKLEIEKKHLQTISDTFGLSFDQLDTEEIAKSLDMEEIIDEFKTLTPMQRRLPL
ncbi:hypothetical protein QTP88_010214 [Uroleucon formosanum]